MHAERLRHRDMLLDVVCDASGRWRWKDEDELELAVAVGAITREDAVQVRAEGERVVAAIERWASPFADGWERWRRIRTGPAPGPGGLGRVRGTDVSDVPASAHFRHDPGTHGSRART